jgi:biopolymer transport protein ExbB
MRNFITAILLSLLFAFYAAPAQAQESDAIADSVATTQDIAVRHTSLHNQIKQKFIEGSALFMSFVALVFVAGLAFCIERIVFLNMSQSNSRRLLEDIKDALSRGDIEMARNACHDMRGPVAATCYQGLLHIDQGADVVEKSITIHGNLQIDKLKKGCSWIRLFTAMAPTLGFLGTILGMLQAFDKIQLAGEISPAVVAGGMKVALISTIFGLIAALILHLFYNYILSKIETITNDMEDTSMSLLDMVIKYNLKYKR